MGESALVTERSLRERSYVQQNYMEGGHTGNHTPMQTSQTHLLMYFRNIAAAGALEWLERDVCGIKKVMHLQSAMHIAFQPTIARKSCSALFHHSSKSALQLQRLSTIFSDSFPPGAFSMSWPRTKESSHVIPMTASGS